MDQTEVEWQFDADDLSLAEQWLAGIDGRTVGGGRALSVQARPRRQHVDRYVDTEDWRLGRAGLVLRTRQNGSGVEVTMKDVRPASSSGLRRRMELTEPLADGSLAALGSSGPVGSRVAAVAGRRPLAPVLEVRTRRQPFALVADGTEVAEVALDDTILVAGSGQRPARLRRVEVEVAPDWVEALEPVVDDLRAAAGLHPATLSKFESGLLAAGVSMPGPPDLGATEVTATATVGDVVYAVIRHNLHEVLAHEPGTRLGEDPEELHDMRVATRRLRAAMSLFSDALPPRARLLRDELRWMAHALGAVRDLDVQLGNLEQLGGWAAGWPEDGAVAMGTLRRLLERKRAQARRDLLGALDSPRWARLVSAMVVLAQRGPHPRLEAAWEPALVALPPLVERRHRQAVKAARVARRTGAALDFHQLRIRCKWLRYATECTGDLYGQDAKRFVKELARLQDRLGSAQDAEVAAARMAALALPGAGRRERTLPTLTVFAMGGIAEHYRNVGRQLRADTVPHVRTLAGPSWKALAATMAAGRKKAKRAAERSGFDAGLRDEAGADGEAALEGDSGGGARSNGRMAAGPAGSSAQGSAAGES